MKLLTRESPFSSILSVGVQIGGGTIPMVFKRSELRAALGLPPHDIFTHGIFHNVVPNLVIGPENNPEQIDVDHQEPHGPVAPEDE